MVYLITDQSLGFIFYKEWLIKLDFLLLVKLCGCLCFSLRIFIVLEIKFTYITLVFFSWIRTKMKVLNSVIQRVSTNFESKNYLNEFVDNTRLFFVNFISKHFTLMLKTNWFTSMDQPEPSMKRVGLEPRRDQYIE